MHRRIGNKGEKSSRLPKLVTKGLTQKVIKREESRGTALQGCGKEELRDRKQKTAGVKTEVQNAWCGQGTLEQMTDSGEMRS